MPELKSRTLGSVGFIAAPWSMLLHSTPALAQTVTAMWDPNPPADHVTGYQVCIGSSSLSCNAGFVSVDASTTSYSFAPAEGVWNFVAVRATNTAGTSPFSSEVSFSIPSLAQPANQSSSVGVAITPMTLSITDPDGGAVTITHTGLPVGLWINSATRQITGTPSAAGTYNVTVFVNDGLVTVSRSFTWTVSNPGVPVCRSSNDFNGDCRADLVWRNSATGEYRVWYLNGATLLGVANLPTVADLRWQVVVSVDMNQDGAADLIWRNETTGQNIIWYLSGTHFLREAYLPTVADPAWQVVTSGDINQDGSSDLIWRNSITGEYRVWYLNGATLLGVETLPSVADLAWQVAASADVNQDGAPDLVWRNNVSGRNVIWFLNRTTIVGAVELMTVSDLEWHLVTALDIGNDGATLIWRHSTGTNYVWTLDHTTVVGGGYLPTVSESTWRMIGAR